ncbi:MAG TPA: glycosyltransferase family 4 protein, partial [Salinimicrobium sp.]|nr:glycosyltransferase family 4 protein [Salinimicrobium sp.]
KNHPLEILAFEKTKPYSSKYRNILKTIVREHKIDVIHLHTSDSVTGYVVTDLFHQLKTPTLFARKGIRRKMGLLSKFKYNYKNIDRILCISEYVKKHFGEDLYNRNRHKLVTVYNGVKIKETKPEAAFQLRQKLNLDPGTFLIGDIANHTQAKDLHTLIKMVDKLVNVYQEKNVHVVQIGKFSKLTPELKLQVEKLGLEPYFTFMGFVKNASTFLAQFDVFVMTSEREGGPSSIVEAFYNKTPVISTKVGVVEEVIEDGINGFSVDVGDADGLAKKIIMFKNNPGLSEEFKEKSYTLFLNKFTAQQLGENTLKVYQDLILNKK